MTHDFNMQEAGRWCHDWLIKHAFGLWAEAGFDPVDGGFVDKLDPDGRALDLPKRARVQARQIYVYVQAGRLDWDGPWRERVESGLDFLLTHFKRPDGLFRASVARGGAVVVDVPDLYDQAFVIFALATVAGIEGLNARARQEAQALLTVLRTRFANPAGGFWELDDPARPLRSNPHMHMLEAVLAWCEHERGTLFEEVAREILTLARSRFLDPASGAVGEYYDATWTFADGSDGGLREPGHQFEWAYLFGLAGTTLAEDFSAESARLRGFGERFGLRDRRPVFALDADGTVRDGSTRLWAVTEWMRTAVLQPTLGSAEAAGDSFAWLRRFLDGPRPGLWHERIDADGQWIEDAVPASSFYHILTGMAPLLRLAGASSIL